MYNWKRMSKSDISGESISGKSFVAHWTWAAQKGVMNANTAKAVRAACSQVLSVLDDWESVDVRELDLSDLFRRFQNKRAKDFVPESLETYKRRFTVALDSFLGYIADPATWKSPFQGRAGRASRREKTPDPPRFAEPGTPVLTAAQREALPTGYIDYPFPLRPGQVAHLHLPADLSKAEAARLCAFLASLALDPA